jgi:hypothetical protein
LSWLFGAGAVSIALWICGIFLSGFALQITVASLCILFVAVGWRAIRHPGSKFVLPSPTGWLEWFLASLLLTEIVLVLVVSCKHTLGWDGLLVWEIKARYAFLILDARSVTRNIRLAYLLPSFGCICGWASRINSG